MKHAASLAAVLATAALACGRSSPPVVPTRVATLEIHVDAAVATVDERFLTVAIDTAQVVGSTWWNPSGDVEGPGGTAKLAPYDFTRARLRRLARELAPSQLRIGGSEADKVYYDMSDTPVTTPPAPYQDVMTHDEWDGIFDFATALDYQVIFALNAGPGPRGGTSNGPWSDANARTLFEYTRAHSYQVALWELGNEVNSFPFIHGLSFQVSPAQFASDTAKARALLDDVLPGAKLSAPSSAFWPKAGEIIPFTSDYLAADGAAKIDVLTWHYYPQQSRRCPLATRRASVDNMFDPAVLDEIDSWAGQVEAARDAHAADKPVILGETGNAQCGGEPGLSNTFAAGFWWIDELAKMAKRGQRVVVRQTLSGSDYGLIDDVTLAPRPDYWTSVLWRRLVGARVLDARAVGDPLLRVYAHCARGGPPGAIVLVIANLDRDSAVSLPLDAFTQADQVGAYELSASDPSSSEIRLNGATLAADEGGAPPAMAPAMSARAGTSLRVRFGPATYGFVVIPNAAPAACP